MTFLHKQSEFLAWLQSDIDDLPFFMNQQDQDHTNIAEEVDLLNANDEEHRANIWSDNQDPDIATKDYIDCVGYVVESYDEAMIYNQLLSEPETTIYTTPEFVTEWCRFVEPADGVISTDALVQPNTQQPYYIPAIDYSDCLIEIELNNEQKIEQASRHEQLPIDQDLRLRVLEWIKLEEIQRSTGCNAFNGKDNSSGVPGGSQHDLIYVDGAPPMLV